MNVIVNFLNDVLLEPVAIQLWLHWMIVTIFVGPGLLLRYESARHEGKVILASNAVLSIVFVLWYSQVGYTRILGLPHILFWIPLLTYLYPRRKNLTSPPLVYGISTLFVLTIVVSLAFDFTDVIRYMLGERAPRVPGAGSP